ncbi:MAG: prolipoprotein diacylglyceryl transferase [Lachnospiraceae bacterium]|nr:prolipoprotein diacylglyceryl transferase [Lachnospiraceae bacterium]
MYNDILTIGPVTIHGYGLMIGIGILCAIFAGIWLAKKKGLSPDEVYNLTFVCVIAGISCAKLLFCIVEWKNFIKDPLGTLGSDGFVVYGGIIGGTLIAGLYTKIRKLDFWDYFDLVLPSVAIAQGFGRIGCFLAGCCYGQRTDSWFGITFHDSGYAPNGVALYPTQLMSSAGCFIMAGILFFYARKDRAKGKTGALYLIMYSIGRAIIEMFRNDYRGSIGFLSTSQFISIFILIIGLIIFFVPKGKQSEDIQ